MSQKYRSDIDGLRSFGILPLLGFHFFPNLIPGGFIAVDIFFVISGFLISKIIFTKINNNSFSFSDFYERRIRRIFPALVVVLFFCLIFGWFTLLADEYKLLGKHVAGGAAFISNLILWNESGYFDNDASTKPLLNLWSLGIEEQFYIIWPFILWLAHKIRLNLLTICITVAASSFILSIKTIGVEPIADFYSPFTRFWELMAGSILAWVTLNESKYFLNSNTKLEMLLARLFFKNKHENYGNLLINIYSITGFFLLLYGFLIIDKEFGFPGKWALIPVCGTLLIIYAGQLAWINRIIFSNRVAIFFGLISYPLYLWHWPLLSFSRIIESETPSTGLRLGAVLISILLAWLTYKFIETPMRSQAYSNLKLIVLIFLMAIIGCIGLFIFKENGLPLRYSLRNTAVSVIPMSYENDQKTYAKCMKLLGLQDPIRYCSVSTDYIPNIAIIGDSHAAALYEALSHDLKVNNSGLLNLGGRLLLDVATYPKGGINNREIDVYKGGIAATEFVANLNTIDTVLMASRGAFYLSDEWELRLISNPTIHDRKKILEIGIRKTLDKFVGVKKRIIFILDNPEINFDPRICLNRPIRLQKKDFECTISRSDFDSWSKEYRDLALSVLKDYPKVEVFDPADYLCDEKNCYARIKGEIIYGDHEHFSADGAKYISRELVKVIYSGKETKPLANP